MLSGNIKNHVLTAWKNPVSKVSLLLFLLFVIGATWSITNMEESLDILKKYNELWYVALLIPLFTSDKRKIIGINVFLVVMTGILLTIYLLESGLIAPIEMTDINRDTKVFTVDGGFSSHILTNILMSFTVFIFAHRSILAKGLMKIPYAILAYYSGYYSIFISTGTTGQILAITLISFFFMQHFRWKSVFIIPLFWIAIISYGLSNTNTSFNMILLKFQDAIEDTKGSGSQRLDFYTNSARIIYHNPWYGSGTGSFKQQYRALSEHYIKTHYIGNPHNEYFSTTVQLGYPGFLLLMLLFYMQWNRSFKIENIEYRYLAQGLVVLIVIGSMGNSMIMDSGEGHFWAFFSALLFSKIKLDE
jgi:O-antigen ligase